MKKRIVLCADDYGQAPPISRGILTLVQKKRLSAVSCMVTTPYWPEHAKWLIPYADQIDIGLHFNLTEGKTALPLLMLKAGLRLLRQNDIAAELRDQIAAFADATGFMPRFIDGHQHVHQFPVIRQALVQVYQELFEQERPYIRVINSKVRPGEIVCDLKKLIVKTMGSRRLARLLKRHHIPYNSSFGGMYNFAKAKEYPCLFNRFLAEIDEDGIIMCHPGYESDDKIDPIQMARAQEYQYFAGPRFPADCAASDVVLSRFLDK